jgi:hypothetical protein
MKSPRFDIRARKLRAIFSPGNIERIWKDKVRTAMRDQFVNDGIENFDFHVAIKLESKKLSHLVLSGDYAPQKAQRILVEKSKGLCRQLVIPATIDDPALADILVFAETSAGFGQEVTQPYADAYRASYVRAARLPKPPRNPVLARTGAAGKFTSMDWKEYSRRVRSSRHHNVTKSLQMLAVARRWFATKASFVTFSPAQRKAIAGVLGENQKDGPDLNRDWGWFGSMGAAGDFANRIEENDPALSKALDGIPQSGEVTRAQYDRYCRLFRQAFARSSRTGGVPSATRLLSMKRPDTFLCVCKPNVAAAAKALGFAPTTLHLDNYWERVVEPIRLSVWYNEDKPDHPDGELWEARAAMLDTLFYRP